MSKCEREDKDLEGRKEMSKCEREDKALGSRKEMSERIQMFGWYGRSRKISDKEQRTQNNADQIGTTSLVKKVALDKSNTIRGLFQFVTIKLSMYAQFFIK